MVLPWYRTPTLRARTLCFITGQQVRGYRKGAIFLIISHDHDKECCCFWIKNQVLLLRRFWRKNNKTSSTMTVTNALLQGKIEAWTKQNRVTSGVKFTSYCGILMWHDINSSTSNFLRSALVIIGVTPVPLPSFLSDIKGVPPGLRTTFTLRRFLLMTTISSGLLLFRTRLRYELSS